jgi:hypothetical protein
MHQRSAESWPLKSVESILALLSLFSKLLILQYIFKVKLSPESWKWMLMISIVFPEKRIRNKEEIDKIWGSTIRKKAGDDKLYLHQG